MNRSRVISWHALASSLTLDACAWTANADNPQGTLYVRWLDGRVIIYADVPHAVFMSLVAATSPGRYYNLSIRGVYDAIEEGDEA